MLNLIQTIALYFIIRALFLCFLLQGQLFLQLVLHLLVFLTVLPQLLLLSLPLLLFLPFLLFLLTRSPLPLPLSILIFFPVCFAFLFLPSSQLSAVIRLSPHSRHNPNVISLGVLLSLRIYTGQKFPSVPIFFLSPPSHLWLLLYAAVRIACKL